MANNSRLISGGANYFIEGGAEYTGSGTPWTVVTTSPYELAMNDVAGPPWTPQAATRQEVYGGGPPFRNGQSLIYDSYGNVIETLVIQCRANSHDNAVFLLQQLRKILNTALFSAPCVLAVQPNGATNAVYFEIYGADVQEHPGFVNEEAANVAAGSALVRAVVTWRRSPHGGSAALATLFTNTTFTNNGSGNLTSLGALTGDLIYEGQPLNLKIDGPAASSTNVDTIWLASAHSRAKTTHTSATGSTTTSTSVHSTATIDATPLLANRGIDLAIFVRFSSVTAGNKALFSMQVTTDDAKVITPQTAWSPMPVTSGTTMVYAGTFSLDGQRIPLATAITLEYTFWVKSTDGTTVAYTVDYTESVFAYTVAEITQNAASSLAYGNGDGLLYVTSAQNLNGQAWFPLTPTRVYRALSAGVNVSYTPTLRGEAPRAFSGASLWAAWTGTLAVHTTTDTLRVTPTHAPQYVSLRGGG